MDNNCNLNSDCPRAGLHAQKPEVYSACTKSQQAVEKVDGCEFSFFSPPFFFLLSVLSPHVVGQR